MMSYFGLFHKYITTTTTSPSSKSIKSKHKSSHSSHQHRHRRKCKRSHSSQPKASITSSSDTIHHIQMDDDITNSMSECKTILIEATMNEQQQHSKSDKMRNIKSKHCKHIKYWTIAITTKRDKLCNPNKMVMGFGVSESQSCHDYGYYYTKLKSMDDILIAFNTQTNKLTLWQNGKRFNRIFEFYPAKIYAFGIKICGDDYSIKILTNSFNLY